MKGLGADVTKAVVAGLADRGLIKRSLEADEGAL